MVFFERCYNIAGPGHFKEAGCVGGSPEAKKLLTSADEIAPALPQGFLLALSLPGKTLGPRGSSSRPSAPSSGLSSSFQ